MLFSNFYIKCDVEIKYHKKIMKMKVCDNLQVLGKLLLTTLFYQMNALPG